MIYLKKTLQMTNKKKENNQEKSRQEKDVLLNQNSIIDINLDFVNKRNDITLE